MNNSEKNASTCAKIFNALLTLLETRELADISISDITRTAGVSRNSFYRNFPAKEEVITKYVALKLRTWQEEYDNAHSGEDKDFADMFGCLFAHIKENGATYLLLKKRGVFFCVLQALKNICGPKAEQCNIDAYSSAMIAYGIFGWIDEWVERGMTESAESMRLLIASRPHKNPNLKGKSNERI